MNNCIYFLRHEKDLRGFQNLAGLLASEDFTLIEALYKNISTFSDNVIFSAIVIFKKERNEASSGALRTLNFSLFRFATLHSTKRNLKIIVNSI